MKTRVMATIVNVKITFLVTSAMFALSVLRPLNGVGQSPSFSPALFANPPAENLPWVRWNLVSEATTSELEAELEDMFNKHIGGAELGQGAYPNTEQLIAILKKANELGIKISLSHGPTQSPAGYSIDDDHARKTLVYGAVSVDAGAVFNGVIAAPTSNANQGMMGGFGRQQPESINTLVAVLAYRCAEAPAASGVISLDCSSVINLTSKVAKTNTAGVLGGNTQGTIKWKAPSSPAGSKWQLISFWSKGVMAQPDGFSQEGTKQLISGIEDSFTPQIRTLLKINGGDFFVDSHSGDGGAPNELWTNNMAEEFRIRCGYPLIPNLPALFPGNYTFSNGSAPRICNDFYAVRGDLWIQNRIIPFQEWARTYNSALRLQAEDITITPITDQLTSTYFLDRPEHESLIGGDQVDIYRPMASAIHMNGNKWLSTECCAALNMANLQTFQDLVVRMSKEWSAGMTKLVYHAYPYRDDEKSQWPGFSNFGQAGFSNAWSLRNPLWMDATTYNDFLARNELILTQGNAKMDVAVFMQGNSFPSAWQRIGKNVDFRFWRDLAFQEAGYTFDYLNQTLLSMPNAKVTHQRLAEQGPAYKAFIVNTDLQPEINPVKTSMPVDVARKILDFAKEGLPVVIVGALPDQTPGNTPSDDAMLKELIHQLVNQKTVYQVAGEADVPAKLRSIGVLPSVDPDMPSSVLSMHRRDDRTGSDYYFLYNQGVNQIPGIDRSDATALPNGYTPQNIFEEPETFRSINGNPGTALGEDIERVVKLEGTGRPYLLDAWSGKIIPIANYATDGESTTFRVRLTRDETMLIALSENLARFDNMVSSVHVTNTTAADAIQRNDGSIAIVASKAGTYTTQLSNGTSVQSTIGTVPAPIDLTHATWNLSVEDWQPSRPYGVTGIDAPETVKIPLSVSLTGLKSWPDITELENVSGVGTYTTTVNLPPEWTEDYGATLELGQVVDTYILTVNEKNVPVNQVSARVDIGPTLHAGANTIVLRVATTLNNRLLILDKNVARRGIIQLYGLTGPVILTPNRQLKVWTNAVARFNLTVN